MQKDNSAFTTIKSRSQIVAILLPIREVLGSKLGRKVVYPDLFFSRFFLRPSMNTAGQFLRAPAPTSISLTAHIHRSSHLSPIGYLQGVIYIL